MHSKTAAAAAAIPQILQLPKRKTDKRTCWVCTRTAGLEIQPEACKTVTDQLLSGQQEGQATHRDARLKMDSDEQLQQKHRPPVSRPQHEPRGHKHAGLSLHLWASCTA